MKIVDNDKPFIKAKAYFTNAKFYLKSYVMKEVNVDDITKAKGDDIASKRVGVASGKAKVTTEAYQISKANKNNAAASGKKIIPLFRYIPKLKKDKGESANLQSNALKELTFPIKQIDAIMLPSNLLRKFMACNMPQNKALPTKHTNKDFDPNAYKLFTKAGYDPNELSKPGSRLKIPKKQI